MAMDRFDRRPVGFGASTLAISTSLSVSAAIRLPAMTPPWPACSRHFECSAFEPREAEQCSTNAR